VSLCFCPWRLANKIGRDRIRGRGQKRDTLRKFYMVTVIKSGGHWRLFLFIVTKILLVERNANESGVNVHFLLNVNRNLNVKHLKASSWSSIGKLSHPTLSFDLYDRTHISWITNKILCFMILSSNSVCSICWYFVLLADNDAFKNNTSLQWCHILRCLNVCKFKTLI